MGQAGGAGQEEGPDVAEPAEEELLEKQGELEGERQGKGDFVVEGEGEVCAFEEEFVRVEGGLAEVFKQGDIDLGVAEQVGVAGEEGKAKRGEESEEGSEAEPGQEGH